MKRIFLLFSLFCMVFSAFSCSSPDDSAAVKTEKDPLLQEEQIQSVEQPALETEQLPVSETTVLPTSGSVSQTAAAETKPAMTTSITTSGTAQKTTAGKAFPSTTVGKTTAPISSTVHHIILSVVHVTKDWSLFDDISGWPGAIINKEAQGVKYYEATIWDDTLSIHLYALPNDYDQSYGFHENLSKEKKVAYRESFCIKKISGMPSELSLRGSFVVDAFTEFARILVQKHPKASHNLLFSGHGGPVLGGEFFGLHVNHKQMNKLLGNWNSLLGRKLGFIDMGGPCMKSGFEDLEAVYEYADYYIASDLSSGCTNWDNWSSEAYNRSDPLFNYPRLLAAHNNMKDALVARVDLTRQRYKDSVKYATNNKVMQSCYLYSCSAFGKHKDTISSFMKEQSTDGGMADILHVMKNGATPELIEAFHSIIIHGVDTKDFFNWPQEWNGLFWIFE